MNFHTRRSFLGCCGVAAAAAQVEQRPQGLSALPDIPEGALAAPGQLQGPLEGYQWRVQYLFDQVDATMTLNDLRFPSRERGIAACSVEKEGHEQNMVLVTHNGGAKWTSVKVKGYPLSLYTLDESRVFLVTADGLYYSNEGGISWEKRKLPENKENKEGKMARVCFVDEKRGWAYGPGKVFYSTDDGGKRWDPVPESMALDLTAANVYWSWMHFVSPKVGMLIGNSQPPSQEGATLPDWMQPERASRRRLLPSTTVLASTDDGGGKWHISVASAFGRANRMRGIGGRGLSLFQFGDNFPFPSEVYAVDFHSGKSTDFFRRKDLTIGDAVPLEGGSSLLATIQPSGKLRNSPIPGKLRMIWSPDGVHWGDMKVDYRAVGRRAVIARVDDENIWVATSEGIILKMVR